MTWDNRPADWDKPGYKIRSLDNELILDQIDEVTSPGWTDFVPTWANTSTQPSIGNGSWDGSRYRLVDGGDLVQFEIVQLWGTTTAGGTGSFWTFGFPLTPSTRSASNFVGKARLEDQSTTTRHFQFAFPFSGAIILSSVTGTLSMHTSPWTWANLDFLKINGWYEPA